MQVPVSAPRADRFSVRVHAIVRPCRAANEAELKTAETAIADAREKFGEVEVADAISKKAAYYARIGDKVCAGAKLHVC